MRIAATGTLSTPSPLVGEGWGVRCHELRIPLGYSPCYLSPTRQGYRICRLGRHVLGLVVRDAPQAALLTMRVYYCAAKQDIILRSPPKAGVSKDGRGALFSQMQLPYPTRQSNRI